MRVGLSKKILLVIALLSVWWVYPVKTASSAFEQGRFLKSLIDAESGHHEALDSQAFAGHVLALSRKHRIDPLMILAIIKVESHFNPQALSHKGARGLMQIMPIVVRELRPHGGKVDLHDPYQNLDLGVRYFARLLKRFDNDWAKALAAYNMGPTAVSRRALQNARIPMRYTRKVLEHYLDYHALKSKVHA